MNEKKTGKDRTMDSGRYVTTYEDGDRLVYDKYTGGTIHHGYESELERDNVIGGSHDPRMRFNNLQINSPIATGAMIGAGATLGGAASNLAIKGVTEGTKSLARGVRGKGILRGLAKGEMARRYAANEYLDKARRYDALGNLELADKSRMKAEKMINKADKIANKKLAKLADSVKASDQLKVKWLKSRLGKDLNHSEESIMSEMDNVFNFNVID